jgi:catechol 2,3-dioxygenase-like lactoylglutathione lyase family enzyme
MRLAWVLATAIFGPPGLLAYLLVHRQRDPQAAIATWRRALGLTVYSVTGNVAGLILVLAFYYFFLPDGDTGPTIFLPPFVVGWLIFRAPLVASASGGAYRAAVRKSLLAEIISTSLVMAGMFPVMFLLSNRWFRGIKLDSPLFWGFVSLGALAGALVVYPYNAWRARRGQAGRSRGRFS